MKLVIVESPSKTVTIKQYLGSDFNVVASKGHIRDVANTGTYNLGLDLKNNLKPIYEVIPKQKSTVKSLNEAASKADTIYLATDPDREGEAISWHLQEVLNLKGKTVKRIEFNEITKPAILEAMDKPRDIDMNIVSSQETRKIIDRIIGYQLSSLLQKNVGAASPDSKVSAGRVQSAVLKMIMVREEEVNSFVPEQYYEIEIKTPDFTAKLLEPGKNKVYDIKDKEDVDDILKKLGETMTVSEITNSTKHSQPTPPLDSSALMQAALNRYNLNSKRTMKIAQGLYEGKEIGGEHIALITYMRTDSTRMSDVFKNQLISFIINTYGKEYLGHEHMKKQNENVQDAHEAIRPVSLSRTPDSVKDYLTKEELNVYTLVYEKAVASMMKDAQIQTTNVVFNNNGYLFQYSFDKTIFPGYMKVSASEKEPKTFNGKEGDVIRNFEISPNAKETQGPERYTEATIIKEMEKTGIGRPSTYASTIDTLKTREYVTETKNKIIPTKQGSIISSFLDEYFPMIINIPYTAKMETVLDQISEGKEKETEIVNHFYTGFEKILEEKRSEIKRVPTGETCPVCGSPMVYRTSKGSRFEACGNWPKCNYIKRNKPEGPEIPLIECPMCHKGHLVRKIAKTGKFAGKAFYGCSEFPACHFTTTALPKIKKIITKTGT